MPAKITHEIVNLKQLVKKLDYNLIKPDIDRAVGDTAEDAKPVLRTHIPIRTPGGGLAASLYTTNITDRRSARSRQTGTPTSGLSAAYVGGHWYGRFPDRGTRYIRARRWSHKTRTQIGPQADANLRQAGNRIAKKWAR